MKKLKKEFKNIKITVLGGGTGLSNLINGLKNYTKNISAVVTVTDDGGSSGRLSRKYGILPPGDIRNCLVSLAEEESLMSKLFQFRFSGRGDISGHNFGNLFIMAMTKIFGSFEDAILESSKILAIKGEVIPATLKKVTLGANLDNGRTVFGETKISNLKSSSIKKVFLKPSKCKASLQAVDAIKNSDLVIIGPGSLYTSIIPNLLINDISNILKKTNALKVFISNIMTQEGETDGFSAEDHLESLVKYITEDVIDYMIINTGVIPKKLLAHYKKNNSLPITFNRKKNFLGTKKIFNNVYNNDIMGKYARHNPEKLAKTIMNIYKKETIKDK